MEIWKPVKNYENCEVSNLGRAKCNGELLKFYYDNGYRKININGDWIWLHRLIAETFIPNPENKPCVDHKNGKRLDNRVNNLRWCTYKENMQYCKELGHNFHNHPSKGKYNDKQNNGIICIELNKQFDSLFDAAQYIKTIGNIQGQIATIKKNIYRSCGTNYSAYKYHWKFG